MDARRSNAYRRYLALVATAAPALSDRELELLREAARSALGQEPPERVRQEATTALARWAKRAALH